MGKKWVNNTPPPSTNATHPPIAAPTSLLTNTPSTDIVLVLHARIAMRSLDVGVTQTVARVQVALQTRGAVRVTLALAAAAARHSVVIGLKQKKVRCGSWKIW